MKCTSREKVAAENERPSGAQETGQALFGRALLELFHVALLDLLHQGFAAE